MYSALETCWDFRLLAALLERVIHEPFSRYRVHAAGGDETFFGWTETNSQLALLTDGQLLQTRATATNKKAKLRKQDFAKRPEVRKKPRRSMSIRELHESKVNRELTTGG